MGDRSAWPTADQLENVFHAALKASDLDGVMASLEVMARVDPDRCTRLMDDLQTAVHLAKRLHEIADEPLPANGRRPSDGE